MTDNRFLAEGEAHSDGLIAIMRTFVLHTNVKVLSGLAALSYIAGREGDDEWAWAAEAEDALIDGFFAKCGNTRKNGPRIARYHKAKATLAAAFRGGVAQRDIDLAVAGRTRSVVEDSSPNQMTAQVCDRALSFARAHATIYLSEIEFPADHHPHAVESEIYRVAAKVARRHTVTAAEAAYCSLKAFEDAALVADWSTAAEALEGGLAGVADREAEEQRAHDRASKIKAVTATLFGAEA